MGGHEIAKLGSCDAALESGKDPVFCSVLGVPRKLGKSRVAKVGDTLAVGQGIVHPLCGACCSQVGQGSICGGDEMEQFDKKLTAISKLCITVKLLVFTHSSASSVQYNKWNIQCGAAGMQTQDGVLWASIWALLAMAGQAGRARWALGALLLARLKSAAT
jgi:hypothetical protein